MVYYGRLGKNVGNFWDKISLTDCKWSSLNAQGSETHWSHPLLKNSLFPFSAPAPSLLLMYKERFIMGDVVKRWKHFTTKSV